MTNDLLVKIDTLIEMSKSTSNYDTLKAEKTEIEEAIENKRKEIEDLKASMQDEKYMKASDRIVDENIKVSLELKIKKLETDYRKLDRELKKKIKEESDQHKTVKDNQDKVVRLTKLIGTLHDKMSSITDKGVMEHYETSLVKDEQKLEQAKQNVSESEEEYRRISRELTTLTERMDILKEEIEGEKDKLESTIENLSTNEAYIDKERKAEDERRLVELEQKLEEHETRKKEIEQDPVMIGNIAKELYLKDSFSECFQKLKILVEYIKTLPYMDITSSNEVEKVLKAAESKAVAERDEFASIVESKKYNGSDTKIVEERQKYLNAKKKELQSDLDITKNRLKKMDTAKFQELNSLLNIATSVQESLKKDLEEYRRVIEQERENSTPKKVTTLLAALQKKEEELMIVQEIIVSYENEIEELMMESKELETEKVSFLEKKIAKTEEDIREISKKVVVSSKANDILALESDKAKLKELNDAIKAITERRKFKKTPSEVLDEIEMALGSFLEEEIVQEVKEEPIIEDNFRIVEEIELPEEEIQEEKEPEIIEETFEIPEIPEIEEKTKEEEIAEVEPVLPVLEPLPIVEIDEPEELKEEEDFPQNERFKVIEIENLEENMELPKEQIPAEDFKDEDFIDFDAIIGGDNE